MMPWDKGYRPRPLDAHLYYLPQVIAYRVQLDHAADRPPLRMDELIRITRIPRERWLEPPDVEPAAPASYEAAMNILNSITEGALDPDGEEE